jgi:hypothetical protein
LLETFGSAVSEVTVAVFVITPGAVALLIVTVAEFRPPVTQFHLYSSIGLDRRHRAAGSATDAGPLGQRIADFHLLAYPDRCSDDDRVGQRVW